MRIKEASQYQTNRDSLRIGKIVIAPQDILNDDNPLRAIRSGRIMARAWAKTIDANDLVAYGQSFMLKIIQAYWNKIHSDSWHRPLPLLFKKISPKNLDNAVSGVAEAIGRAATGLSVVQASYLLGNVYTAVLPETTRTSGGVFYTPPSLTARLIKMVEDAGIDWAKVRVIDPACGGGAFLGPVCIKMLEQLHDQDPKLVLKHIEANLVGWEIDPFGGWLTQVFVEVVLKDLLVKTKLKLAPLVKIRDSLEASSKEIARKFDLVIGNPPYGKIKLTEPIHKRYKESLYGHPNLYGLFSHLAVQLVAKKGIVALLTPTSFLSGEYFKNLRQLIRQELTPLEMDLISIRKGVFEDVLQEVMLSVYVKNENNNNNAVEDIRINQLIVVEEGVRTSLSGTIQLPLQLTAPWVLPRHANQAPLVRAMSNMGDRLSDWGYKVSTGPLVWNRHKTQLKNKSGLGYFPVIWAEAVTQDGRFVLKAEKKNHSPYFKFSPGDEWLVTTKPCILLQRTTAKEQEKRLIAALLPPELVQQGVVVENHLNMIIPEIESPLVDVTVLCTFLNSQVVNEAFRAISGSVAVSAYELEALPLPPPQQMQSVFELLSDNATPALIEQAILNLYIP